MGKIIRFPGRHARSSSQEDISSLRDAISAKTSNVISGRPRLAANATTEAQCGAGMPRRLQPLTTGKRCPSASATSPSEPEGGGDPPQRSSMSESQVVMAATIVRTVRTGQGFASRETTSSVDHGPIGPMIDDPKIVAKRLKNLREALGISTQVAFAKELGIEKNTYNPFEKGTRELTFETACLIRKRFRIPIDWLFWGDDDELPYHVKVKLEARRQAA